MKEDDEHAGLELKEQDEVARENKEESSSSGDEADAMLTAMMAGLRLTAHRPEALTRVAERIRSGQATKIVVLTGAGISVAAGIPDFRTPGSGLYDNLQKYKLPYPTAVFELAYFRRKPQPFFRLARELWPGNYCPTPAHAFVRLLAEKNVLLRNFTQNIDTLEAVAGVPADRVVEAHGSFASATCQGCGYKHEVETLKRKVFQGRVPRCPCGGVIKPDIVFFGEDLPERYFQRAAADLPECDLLLIMGTSLVVHPFATLIDAAPFDCPRLLINRDPVGFSRDLFSRPLDFSTESSRDSAWLGDIQDGVRELCKLLDWESDLDDILRELRKQHSRNESDNLSIPVPVEGDVSEGADVPTKADDGAETPLAKEEESLKKNEDPPLNKTEKEDTLKSDEKDTTKGTGDKP